MKYVIGWLVCGILAAGLLNNNRDTNYDYGSRAECNAKVAEHQSFSIVLGLVSGPIGLILALSDTGFGYKGWRIGRGNCYYTGPM